MITSRQKQSSGGSQRGFSVCSLGGSKSGGSRSSGFGTQSLYSLSSGKKTATGSSIRVGSNYAAVGFSGAGGFGGGAGGFGGGAGGFGGGAGGFGGGAGGFGGGAGGFGGAGGYGGGHGGDPDFPVCPPGGIQEVSINQNLLKPLNVEVDPNIKEEKNKEKEQIKTLNNKFAGFIDKVRFLEQQNKVLQTKYELLKEQGHKGGSKQTDLVKFYEAFINHLSKSLNTKLAEKTRLETEEKAVHVEVEEYKKKYEEEINKRTAAENEFVTRKKDVDSAYMKKSDFESQVTILSDECEFWRTLYDAKAQNVQGETEGTSAIVTMDNSRNLNMDDLLKEVKAQFEAMQEMNKAQTQALLANKMQQLKGTVGEQGDHLKNTKNQIAELNRKIQKCRLDIESVKKQITALQTSISDAEAHGEHALTDAKKKLGDCEAALQKEKEHLARLLHDFQSAFNAKCTLLAEIGAYNALLTGEEDRISGQVVSSVSISVSGGGSSTLSGGGQGFAVGSGAGYGFGGGHGFGASRGHGYRVGGGNVSGGHNQSSTTKSSVAVSKTTATSVREY